MKAELAVVRLMTGRGWNLEFQRCETTIAEIDLIFSKNSKVVIIEVKRLDNSWRSFERLGSKQLKKLQSNLIYLQTNIKRFEFSAAVCWVDCENRVSPILID